MYLIIKVQYALFVLKGGYVKRVRFALRNALGVTGILLAGYAFVTSLPDVIRYIKITRM